MLRPRLSRGRSSARTTAAPKSVRPKCSGGFGLDVAQFVHSGLRQLQMAQRPTRRRVIDALKVAFQEIRPLRRDDDRGMPCFAARYPAALVTMPRFCSRAIASTRPNANSAYSYSSPGAGHGTDGCARPMPRDAWDRRRPPPNRSPPSRPDASARRPHRTRSAAHSRHTGDATSMTVDIDRRGRLHRASHIFRARLRLGSGAGGETHQRACCQHITPRHRGPARRFAQPRVAELVAPARRVVAGDTPGTGQAQRLPAQRHRAIGEDLDRSQRIARHAARAAGGLWQPTKWLLLSPACAANPSISTSAASARSARLCQDTRIKRHSPDHRHFRRPLGNDRHRLSLPAIAAGQRAMGMLLWCDSLQHGKALGSSTIFRVRMAAKVAAEAVRSLASA